MMKRLNILVFIFLCTSSLYAQDKQYEKIKALKVGFITEQLDLTPKEAQSFWPIYNAYNKTHSDLRIQERLLMNGNSSTIDELTEEEANTVIKKWQAIEAAQEKAEITYIADLESVISSKKIIKLLRAEKDFRRKLLQRLREEKSNRPKRPR